MVRNLEDIVLSVGLGNRSWNIRSGLVPPDQTAVSHDSGKKSAALFVPVSPRGRTHFSGFSVPSAVESAVRSEPEEVKINFTPPEKKSERSTGFPLPVPAVSQSRTMENSPILSGVHLKSESSFSPVPAASLQDGSVTDGASPQYFVLMDTMWDQSGSEDYTGWGYTYEFNKYFPWLYSGGTQSSTRALAGCTNVAIGQTVYYWVKQGWQPTINLTETDNYKAKLGERTVMITADSSTASALGYLSFAEVNKELKEITYDSEHPNGEKGYTSNDIGALCFALAVIGQSNYNVGVTDTSTNASTYLRVGFASALNITASHNYFFAADSTNVQFTVLTEAGWNVLVDNLNKGQTVIARLHAYYQSGNHAVVIDGYDETNKAIHINYGWGKNSTKTENKLEKVSYYSGTGWYTFAELNTTNPYGFIIDATPLAYDGTAFSVTSNSAYGLNTLNREIEQINAYGENTYVAADGSSGNYYVLTTTDGLSIGLSASTTVLQNSTEVKGGSFSLTVTNSSSPEELNSAFGLASTSGLRLSDFSGSVTVHADLISAGGVVGAGTSSILELTGKTSGNVTVSSETLDASGVISAGGLLVEAFSGTAIVNAKNADETVAFGAVGLSMNATVSGGRVFAGSYLIQDNSTYFTSVTTIRSQLARPDSNLSAIVAAGTGFAFRGGAGADTVSITNSSLVIGGISLYQGSDVVTVDSTSVLYGEITGAAFTLNLAMKDDFSGTAALVNIVSEETLADEGCSIVVNLDGALADSASRTRVLLTSETSLRDAFSQKVFIIRYQNSDTEVTVGGNSCDFAKLDFVNNDRSLRLTVSNLIAYDNGITVTADKTEVTNTAVTLTAVFSKNSASQYYSVGNQTDWKEYTQAGVSVSENATVWFKSISKKGLTNLVSYQVSNIDTTPPEAPVITISPDTPTNGSVTVSAAASSDTAYLYYSLDKQKSWTLYQKTFSVNSNRTIYFKALDPLGNSSISSYRITNIDKIAPDAPSISPSTAKRTNQNVSLTATYTSDSTVREYSWDGRTWLTYTEPVEVTVNNSVYFRAADAAGNLSEVAEYTVSNIDKTAPDEPVLTPSRTLPTNQNITVSAKFSSDTVRGEYSLDGKTTWTAYTGKITIPENLTVYVRAFDDVGNRSEAEYTVSNIDRTVPAAPSATMDPQTETNRTITILVKSDIDASKLAYYVYYAVGEGGWKRCGEYVDSSGVRYGMVVTGVNDTFYFKTRDTAGNKSAKTVFAVSNSTNPGKTAGTAMTLSKATGTYMVQNSNISGYFKFTLTDDSACEFRVSGLDLVSGELSKMTLAIYDSKLKLLTKSISTDCRDASVIASLKAGTYYYRVIGSKNSQMEYRVGAKTVSLDNPDNPGSTPETAGKLTKSYTDYTVGREDKADYFKFGVGAAAEVKISLKNVSTLVAVADTLDVAIYDSSLKLISKGNLATEARTYTYLLQKGTYYFKVFPAGGKNSEGISQSVVGYSIKCTKTAVSKYLTSKANYTNLNSFRKDGIGAESEVVFTVSGSKESYFSFDGNSFGSFRLEYYNAAAGGVQTVGIENGHASLSAGSYRLTLTNGTAQDTKLFYDTASNTFSWIAQNASMSDVAKTNAEKYRHYLSSVA